MTNPSHSINGIHHVTAMCGEPQRNIDFYTGVLGLRLVKVTVNYDDPGTYHLYYGDGAGTPGTIITFFPWPHAIAGKNGSGMATEVAFTVPADSLDYWRTRLVTAGITAGELTQRFGQPALPFTDPDGLRLAIVGAASAGAHTLQGIYSITLTEASATETDRHLADTMGLVGGGREGDRSRYVFGGGGAGRIVDVVEDKQAGRGRVSSGAIHHVAWRVADDEAELYWHARLIADGRHVSPVMDRTYFHSIYWREPGGVLFEIATDPPGFTADEPLESLGEELRLPAFLEPRREELMEHLPKIETHTRETGNWNG